MASVTLGVMTFGGTWGPVKDQLGLCQADASQQEACPAPPPPHPKTSVL